MSVPVDPGRDQAREWLRRELLHREYQDAKPGPFSRALSWLFEHVQRLLSGAGDGSLVGTAIVVVVVALVIGWAVWRAGGLRGQSRRRTQPALGDSVATAEQHRAAADAAARDGDWNTAVLERFRAIARELEERTVLSRQNGRTAHEIATAAAAARPDLSPAFGRAADAFDDVLYGHLDAAPGQDDELRALDERVRTTTPALVVEAAGATS